MKLTFNPHSITRQTGIKIRHQRLRWKDQPKSLLAGALWSFSGRLKCYALHLSAAAAAAKSLQSCPTLCKPHRRQPTRLPRPWDSPGKNTGVGCHFLLQCMKVKSERAVAQLCPTLSDPMDCVAHQAPPSMGFSRQEYWSGVPLPSPSTPLLPGKSNSFTCIPIDVRCSSSPRVCSLSSDLLTRISPFMSSS